MVSQREKRIFFCGLNSFVTNIEDTGIDKIMEKLTQIRHNNQQSVWISVTDKFDNLGWATMVSQMNDKTR